MTLAAEEHEADGDQQHPQQHQAEIELAHELAVVDQDAQALAW